MKTRFLLILSIILALFGSVQGQKAMINFKKNSFDFGEISEKQGVVNCIYRFTNSGDKPLIIQRVVSSCDCAVAEWPKEPIAPGAGGTIKVVFNPAGRTGKFEKLITLYSNAETPTTVLYLNGQVLDQPKTMEDIYNRVIGNYRFKNVHASFNRVYNDEIKIDTIDYIYTGSEPVKVGAKYTGMPFLKVLLVPEILKTNEKGLIIITYDAKARGDWGFLVDRFTLTQNGNDIPGSLITVSATIEENFAVLSNAQKAKAARIEVPVDNFDFGDVYEGDLIEKVFEFSNIGQSELIIRKIKASCGCTTVEPADKVIKPKKKSSVKASVKTNGFSGRIAKTVTIITNDPVNPSITIRMTGNVLQKNK